MVTPPEGSGGVGLRAVPVGGEPAIPCGGGVFVGVVDGVRVAAAIASTLPTTISLPAARPSCAAVSRTRSATIVPRAAEDLPRRLATDCERTSRVPQSASGTLNPGEGTTSWPRARSPATVDPATSPPAERRLAPALAWAVTWDATTSPPKRERATVSAWAWAVAVSPDWAETVACDTPTVTTEPSSG